VPFGPNALRALEHLAAAQIPWYQGKEQGILQIWVSRSDFRVGRRRYFNGLQPNSLLIGTGNLLRRTRSFRSRTQEQEFANLPGVIDLFLTRNFVGEENETADETLPHTRYGEAFWPAHHEAWRRSDLNQRECCDAQGFRSRHLAEPQPPERKLLYRRGRLSHTVSHSLRRRRALGDRRLTAGQ
jgi:hypothetical protein